MAINNNFLKIISYIISMATINLTFWIVQKRLKEVFYRFCVKVK